MYCPAPNVLLFIQQDQTNFFKFVAVPCVLTRVWLDALLNLHEFSTSYPPATAEFAGIIIDMDYDSSTGSSPKGLDWTPSVVV